MSTSGAIIRQLRYESDIDDAARSGPHVRARIRVVDPIVSVLGNRRNAFAVAVAALAVAAATWAAVGSLWIFPQLSANSDEGIYLLQADALSEGHLAPYAAADDPDAYLPWFAVIRGDNYVLKYTPVHAATLAAGDLMFGTPRVALALLASAQVALVVALARELGASRRASLVGGTLFVLSPLVLQLSITYLPYGTSLALLIAAAIAALRAARTGSRWFAVAAGVAWGLAAFARPYDAVLGGAAIAAGVALRDRRHPRQLIGLTRWTALGAAGPLLAVLAFNHAMTGDALQLPFNLLEPRDGPGFGLRRALPTDAPLDYTPVRALSALGRNLLLVAAWTGGGLLTCALALFALARRRLRGGGFLVAILVIWPVGYLLFWGSYLTAYVWDGALFLGPYYYLPMVAALSIAGGLGLTDLWKWHRAVGALATIGVLLLSAGVGIPALADQRDRTSQRTVVADAIDSTVEAPALVFVPPLYGPYLQNPFSFLRNEPEIGGDVVFALDRGDDSNARVRSAYPERNSYRLIVANGWSDQPGFEPDVKVVQLTSETG